ncbi:carboxypeptidase regulatory-like domain-containing protein [bacterium]|nr:carboxypeptidase regulatory-like domain-containing protein [bacterium]
MKPIILLLVIIFCSLPSAIYAQAGHALDYVSDGNQGDHTFVARDDVYNCEHITLEVWIKPDQVTARDRWDSIINKPYVVHQAPHYQWLLNRHQDGYVGICFTINNNANSARSDQGMIELGEWHHLAATYDGEIIKLYMNGELAGETEIEGSITGYDTDVFFGRLGNVNTDWFEGIIEEVRIWNYARDEDDIRRTMSALLSGQEDGLIGYWRFDEGEGQTVEDLSETGNDARLGANNGEDAADPGWVESDAPLYGGEAELSAEVIDFGPVASGQTGEFELEVTNTTEEDDDVYAVTCFVTIPEDLENWLSVEPAELTVNPRELGVLTFSAETEGLELGEYEGVVILESNARNMLYVELPWSLFVVEGFGRLHGRVIEAEFEQPVANAVVTVDYYRYFTETDENGEYEFPEIPAWTYDLVVTAEDYLPMWEREVVIENEADVTIDFALLYSEFRIEPGIIEVSLEPDDRLEIGREISNIGNGPLRWSIERVFPEGVDAEPWELRDSTNLEELLEDTFINGIVFADGCFYVSGGNNGENINYIYVLNSDGELQRRFEQFSESRYGIRDLTWDGTLLWGGDDVSGILYGFTTGGELITSMQTDAQSYRNLTWDPDRNLFWTANITSNFIGIDVNGNQQAEIARPGDLRTYGLAYWTEAPDGYNLYSFSRGDETDLEIFKINPDNGEMLSAAQIDFIAECRPGGISVTNRYDPYSWVMVSIIQSPDHLTIFHLASRTDWITVDPVEGVLEANDHEQFTVTLSSEGMLPETDYSAELLFTHDGIGGENVVQVDLSITGEGGLSQRNIRLKIGWNSVSLNVQPTEEDIPELMEPLVSENLLILIKDGFGSFYHPETGYNNLQPWQGLQGYKMKMAGDCVLQVEGEVIPWDTPIDLSEGWNLISYLPRQAVDVRTALAGLGDALVIAKSGGNGFYIPAWDFSNMPPMHEGTGYYVNVDTDVRFVYQLGDERAAYLNYYSDDEITWLSEIPGTGSSYSLLLLTESLNPGTRLEAFNGKGIIVGRGVVDRDGRCGITLRGDDSTTGAVEGLVEGESPVICLSNGKELTLHWLDGFGEGWINDGWGVAAVEAESLPVEFGINSLYPNPFNSSLTVIFSIESPGEVTLKTYDLSGREVGILAFGKYDAGTYRVQWNAEKLPSGLYLIGLNSVDGNRIKKVVLVK